LTDYEFALYLDDSAGENETKALLWGKVLAETGEEGDGPLSDYISIYDIQYEGKRVVGQYHVYHEDDFVKALKKHCWTFCLHRLEVGTFIFERKDGDTITYGPQSI